MSTSSDVSPAGYPITVLLERPQRSSRLLLIFRGFLAFPHFFFALVVFLLAYVAVLISYVVVLITGRNPFAGFVAGVLRYVTRLSAYLQYLTDKYPPFSLGEDPDYPVRVVIPQPGKLPRWRVLSSFLLFPHYIALYVVLIIAGILTIFVWVAILITGRYPAGFFGFISGALRWQTRVNAYVFLVAQSYPPFSLD